MIDAVGVSDTLRVELSENGPVNTPEFGSVKTQEGFEGPLHDEFLRPHCARRRAAIRRSCLRTGINDPRVTAPWQAAKNDGAAASGFTGKRQADSAARRLSSELTYGDIGNTKEQVERENADEWSFLGCGSSGFRDFQPAKVMPRPVTPLAAPGRSWLQGGDQEDR